MQQQAKLFGSQTMQGAHIDVPEALGFTDQPCPGACCLPTLKSLTRLHRLPVERSSDHRHPPLHPSA